MLNNGVYLNAINFQATQVPPTNFSPCLQKGHVVVRLEKILMLAHEPPSPPLGPSLIN